MEINKIKSLVELFFEKYKEKKSPTKQPFLKWLKNNEDNFLTWEQTRCNIIILSDYLRKILTKGDRCVLLSENRPEWLISDIAIMNAGGVTVPLFTTYSEKDYEYILNNCKPKVCIVSNNNQLKKIEKFISDETRVLSIDKLNQNIENVRDIFEKHSEKSPKQISLNYNNKIERKDLACIIYTSGTTGNPKGVMLSHGGILSNCEGASEILNSLIKEDLPVFLTWLPLSHSYEHTVQYVQISLGAKIYYAESLEKLLPNMSVAKPTIMTAVPRKKIKNQFGGKLKAFVSGGGALDQKIGEFLNSIGLPTLQGYGLTETSPVVSCNIPGKIKIETVGPPFKTNEVKIADDGEILVKGENIMLGYWNMKKETEEVIRNGWLHTGDIGEITKDGNLKITDRKKEIIVNLGGDNISPSKIENLLCLNEKIKQSFVYGDKKTFLSALVVSDSKENKKEIEFYIENLNKSLSLVEKVKKFKIIDQEFTIENGMLTPTLKLKRKKILENYKEDLEKLY
jgi:long-chain acyl-CoA synthetase